MGITSTKNNELRFYATEKGVKLWQVAEKFGVTDATFSKRLRKPFSKEDSELFKTFVDDIAGSRLREG